MKEQYQRDLPDDLEDFSFEVLAYIKKHEPERYAEMNNSSKLEYEWMLNSIEDKIRQKEAEKRERILTPIIIIIGGIILGFLLYKFL